MRKKLRSQQGIAMIFAIAVFAVVMVLGAVFLTAGYANYSKLFGRKNDRQDYYTLVSAARYAGSQLDGATIKISEVYDDDNKDGTFAPEERNSEAEALMDTPAFGGVSDWSVEIVKVLYNAASVSYELSLSNGDDFDENILVNITEFSLEKDWFTMTLSTEDGKNTAQIQFTISPAYGEADSLVTKENKEVNRKIKDTTYTFRMGDIITGNGGSES